LHLIDEVIGYESGKKRGARMDERRREASGRG